LGFEGFLLSAAAEEEEYDETYEDEGRDGAGCYSGYCAVGVLFLGGD
jgi:hypothetical protein